MLVIDQFTHDSVADSLWWPMSEAQTYSLVNDTTLSISLGTLEFGTNYTATIKNLRTIDTLGDTLTVPDTIHISFKTAYGTAAIIGSSVLDSGGIIRCGDTVRVVFNQPLDSANTPTGPIFEISALNPTNDFPSSDTDTTIHYMYSDSLVPSMSWLDPGNRSIVCIRGSNLQPGQSYLFREWVSRLTGDSSQNMFYTLNVKGSAAIQISQTGIIGDSTYPDRTIFAGYSLHSGDTGTWVAPAIADSFGFSHWSCPGYTSIDGSTNDTLKVTFDCSNLQDLNVSAVYFPLPNDTLNIDSLSQEDSVSVYAQDGTLIGVTGGGIAGAQSPFPIRQSNVVIIEAHPAPGYIFDHWNSNDGSINGSHKPFVPIKILGPVWATPIFVGNPPIGTCGLCGDVFTDELDWSDFSTSTNYSPYAGLASPVTSPTRVGLAGCFAEKPKTCPPNNDCSCHNDKVILQINTPGFFSSPYMPAGTYSDVGLWQTIIDGVASPASPSISQAVLTASNNHVYDDPPPIGVEYNVHRFYVKFQVEIAMSDGSQPPSSLGLIFGAKSLPVNTGTVFLSADQSTADYKETPWSSTQAFDEYDMTYKAGVSITEVEEATSDEYQFVSWTTQTSTDGGQTWFASTDGGTTWTAVQNVSKSNSWGATQIHANADWVANISGTIIKVVAVFQKKFTLLKLAVNQDINFTGSSTNNVYDADITGANPWSADEKEIFIDGPNEPSGSNVTSLKIDFYFSDAIDPSTLWKNISCTETQDRIDGEPPVTYLLENTSQNYTLSPDRTHLTWYVAGIGGLMFTYKGQTHLSGGVWFIGPKKLQKYDIQLTDGLQSTSHVPLSNPTTGSGGYIGETINPNVTWTVVNTEVDNFDESWGCLFGGCLHPDHTCTCYITTSGSYAALEEKGGLVSAVTQTASQTNPTTSEGQCFGILSGTSYNFNTPILTVSRPRDASALSGSVLTYDEDKGDILDQVNKSSGIQTLEDAADKTASEVGQALLQGYQSAPAGEGLAGAFAALGAVTPAQILEIAAGAALTLSSWLGNSDDIIAKSTWMGTKENWWGAKLPLSQTNGTNDESGMGTTTTTIKVALN